MPIKWRFIEIDTARVKHFRFSAEKPMFPGKIVSRFLFYLLYSPIKTMSLHFVSHAVKNMNTVIVQVPYTYQIDAWPQFYFFLEFSLDETISKRSVNILTDISIQQTWFIVWSLNIIIHEIFRGRILNKKINKILIVDHL